MEIEVYRFLDDGKATLGMLYVDGVHICFTLEDEHRDFKVSGETRIPAGRYKVSKKTGGRFYEAYNQRWGHEYALAVDNVPGFTDIMIHTGVNEGHTAGCLLVGFDASIKNKTPILNQSRNAYAAIYNLIAAKMDYEGVWLTIYDNEFVS